MKQGVIWITGLSGAGKTTLARETKKVFIQKGVNAIHLDGDEIREIYPEKNLYEKQDRLKLSYFYSDLAKLLANQGYVVIVSVIALFEEIHNYNALKLPNFFLVYLEANVAQLVTQNSKNVYGSGVRNKKVVGLDIGFDIPNKPHKIIPDFIELNPLDVAEELYASYTNSNRNTQTLGQHF